MPTKADRQEVPKFATELEEAKWWDEHKDMVEENLIQALKDGTTRLGTARRLAREARDSKDITIRLAESDLDLARQQAEEKGLPYETYIKFLLHEALLQRQRRRAS